jgi:hypothetical protein
MSKLRFLVFRVLGGRSDDLDDATQEVPRRLAGSIALAVVSERTG